MPLEHRGFGVHISCNGQEIPHYGAEVESITRISCWIPSEPGAEFAVHYDDHREDMNKVVRVYCDGRYMNGAGSMAGWGNAIDSVVTGPREQRPMLFSHVVTTDDEDAQDYVDVAALGTIEVRFFHGVLESLAQTPEGVNHVADVGVVSELSKKGGLHQTSLGPARFRQPVVSRKMMRVEPENRPFASFVFRHRPAATLQAMGIMTHPVPHPAAQPQAGPSNTKRERTQSPIASGSGSGSGPVKRRRTSHAAQDVITIEDSDDDAPRVKPERALSPIRVPAASVGEMIDLTGDD